MMELMSAAFLHKNPRRARIVIVTESSKDTILEQDTKLSMHPVPPIVPKEIIDLNGDYDGFVRGLLAYLSKGRSIEEAIQAGHCTSASS
jgi:adenosine kinase